MKVELTRVRAKYSAIVKAEKQETADPRQCLSGVGQRQIPYMCQQGVLLPEICRESRSRIRRIGMSRSTIVVP